MIAINHNGGCFLPSPLLRSNIAIPAKEILQHQSNSGSSIGFSRI